MAGQPKTPGEGEHRGRVLPPQKDQLARHYGICTGEGGRKRGRDILYRTSRIKLAQYKEKLLKYKSPRQTE